MKSRTIDRQTTAKVVAERLRSEILRGEIPPASRLTQNEVADRLGVSTTPVREAFALLEADGLIRLDQYRGAVVYKPTVEELIELFEMRIVLETLAMTKAVPNMTGEQLDELQAILDRMRVAPTEERLELHRDWHGKLVHPAGRPRLERIVASLRASARIFYDRLNVSGRMFAEEDDDHQEILNACRAGNVEKAVTLIDRHLRATHEETLRELANGASDSEERAAG
jgi:DNA-binding GntR family transcriptional regulator